MSAIASSPPTLKKAKESLIQQRLCASLHRGSNLEDGVFPALDDHCVAAEHHLRRVARGCLVAATAAAAAAAATADPGSDDLQADVFRPPFRVCGATNNHKEKSSPS